VHYTLLIIDWINNVTQDVIRETMSEEVSKFLPDDQIAKGEGITILHETAYTIQNSRNLNGIQRVNEAVNAGIDKLINAINVPSDQQLHQMRLITKQLPVYEMIYKHGSASKNLWVIGLDRRVFAPKFPVAMKRYIPMIAAIVCLSVGLVTFFVLLSA
jgi:hypothetical protein